MNQRAVGPAIRKAFEHVKSGLENGTWLAGECLPSARELAAHAQVSIASMIRAVAILKAKRLVTSIERGHIRAGSGAVVARPESRPAGSIRLLKRSALEQDMLSGLYSAQNRLPTVKELQVRYGVGYRTMQRILFDMTGDGALRLQGRTYELGGMQPHPSRHRILFLAPSFETKPLSALNRGQYRIFDLLEYECIRRGIQLKIMEIDRFNAAREKQSSTEASGATPETGFIIDLWWSVNEDLRALLVNLLARLSTLKKPVAILDENGDFELPLQFVSNPLIQVFRIEGKKAGSRVARFLLGLGHRSVAFVSSLHHSSWSRERFEGVAEQYAKAGCSDRLTKVVMSAEMIREHMFAFSDFDERLIRRLLPHDPTRSEDELYKRYLEFKEGFSARQFTPEDIQGIRMRLNIVKDLAERTLSDSDLNQIVDAIFWQISGAVNPRIQSPLFKQALANRNVTAWICANDDIALTALSYLQAAGVRVPEDLSVVGFDNQPVRALKQRLTSLDFNAPAFVHRMLNHIARPPKPRGPYRHVPIEVESVVMERDTTALPRQ
jgi:DNA-binding LacI/PurR family transcriptional regulator/DNA-binding transcriptional regulator YhcF (GntR family)